MALPLMVSAVSGISSKHPISSKFNNSIELPIKCFISLILFLLFVAKTSFNILKIPFNIPFVSGNEVTYINEVIHEKVFSSPGKFARKCENELSKLTECDEIRLTTSCTSALELAALAIDLKAGDEVILPSFT